MPFSLPSILSLMVITALLNLILQRRHILMALLSLEASILALTTIITLIFAAPAFSNMFFCIVILTFGACEASVALAILVFISRSYGSDMIKSLTSNKC